MHVVPEWWEQTLVMAKWQKAPCAFDDGLLFPSQVFLTLLEKAYVCDIRMHTYVTYVCTCMIRVCEPWLHTRLNTVYACIHLDLALPPRTRPRHGAPPEGEGPARRLQGAGGESGTPTRTAPTARTTSSTWPSRARAASCEARGSEGGRGVRVRDTEGEVSGSCIHTIHSSVGG